MNIALQITEARKHQSEMSALAGRNGKDQSGNRLRFDTATAIVATLEFCRDNEAEIRAYMAAKRAHTPTQTEGR